MRIFSTVIQGLGTAIELHAARQRVLAENVANAETPGYRARDLDFGAELANAFTPGAVPENSRPAVSPIEDRTAIVKIDRNSVDLDTQMARLSENALKLRALSEILGRKYAGLKRVIEGGAR